jgi:DnaK suppressor protein
MAVTAGQRRRLGELLERERRKLIRRLQRFGEDIGELEHVGFSDHMAEAAASLADREKAFMMAGEEGERLVAVNRALDRLARSPEAFGVCRSCGAAIAYERLEALPYTDVCIACKRLAEGGGAP